jgi:hypothetical protein
MSSHILRAQLSKGYLAQDRDRVVLDAPVLLIVLETVSFALYCISKHVNRSKYGLDILCHMPLGYIFNIMSCVCSICKSNPLVFYLSQYTDYCSNENERRGRSTRGIPCHEPSQ